MYIVFGEGKQYLKNYLGLLLINYGNIVRVILVTTYSSSSGRSIIIKKIF